MRETLGRWLGPAAQSADLPVPALVDFDVRPGANLSALQQRARTIAPGARIVAHSDSVGPLLHSFRLLQWVAFGLVLLLSAAASAAVVLAARGALDTHRFTIEVMHGIGATDLQVTHLFQRKILIDAWSAASLEPWPRRWSCCFLRAERRSPENSPGGPRSGRSTSWSLPRCHLR